MLLWIILGYIGLITIALIPRSISVIIRYIITPLVLGGITLSLQSVEWSGTTLDFLNINRTGTMDKSFRDNVVYAFCIASSSVFLYLAYFCIVLYGIGLTTLRSLGVNSNSPSHTLPRIVRPRI